MTYEVECSFRRPGEPTFQVVKFRLDLIIASNLHLGDQFNYEDKFGTVVARKMDHSTKTLTIYVSSE